MLPNRAELEPQVIRREPSGEAPGTRPAVTVVTVVFNAVKGGRRDDLVRCLESVQTQEGVAAEHVVVDGGSQDGTVGLVRDFANARHPIRLFSAPDGGIYEAMNRGIALADGKYVVFLNSDDFYCAPRGLAASVAALEKSGADFSYAPARVVDETGKDVPHPFCEASPYQVFEGMTLCHQTILTRRDALVAFGGFDVRYRSAADYDLLFRMIFEGRRACRVDVRFVTFRTGGFSAVNAELADREVGQVYAELFNRYVDAGLSEADGLKLRAAKEFSPGLALRLHPFGARTFGDEFRPGPTMLDWWKSGTDYAVVREAGHWLHSRGRTPRLRDSLAFAVRHPRRIPGFAKGALLHLLHCGGNPLGDLVANVCEELAPVECRLLTPADVLAEHPECHAVREGLAVPHELVVRIGISERLRSRKAVLTVLQTRDGELRRTDYPADSDDERNGFVERTLSPAGADVRAPLVFSGAYLTRA